MYKIFFCVSNNDKEKKTNIFFECACMHMRMTSHHFGVKFIVAQEICVSIYSSGEQARKIRGYFFVTYQLIVATNDEMIISL